jgi:hypothetical protein
MRATILIELAKDAPELEDQLLYVAKKWLTLAILSEQLNAGANRAANKLSARLSVPNIRFSMDAVNRRGKFAT